jgi:hypothetical protein
MATSTVSLPALPRLAAMLVAIASIGLTAGCGDGRVATAPVAGRVLVDGQPAAGAVVVLHPADAASLTAEAEKLRPMGRTDEAGDFTLGTWESSDGAPAGRWKATVEWYLAEGASANADPESADAGVDRLGGVYANPDTTPLSVEIASGGTTLPPFELSSTK